MTEALALYVKPLGKRTSDATTFDLETEVDKFLSSNKKVLLLLGEAGSGKSTFVRHLTRNLWEAHSSQDPLAPIPLFISLPTLRDPYQNLIQEYLKDECELSDAQIRELQKNREFIFILDGYDEIPQRTRFYDDNKFTKWRAKVIVTCRPGYLGVGYQNNFQPWDSGN